MGLLALRGNGLATDSAADSSRRCNNSVNCFARTQIYRLDAHGADCCRLSCVQPLPIYWGPAIRAYSLLVALSLLTINEFFHWYRQRGWWSGARCAAVVLLLLLAHLNGVYTVAFLVLLLAAETLFAGWSGGRKFLWESRTLWIPLAVVAIIVGVAYWRLLPDIAKVNREWGTDTPPTSMGYIPQVFATYMGVGYAGYVVRAVAAGRRVGRRCERSERFFCCVERSFWAPILMSLQGVSVNTSAYARYLIFSLPLLLILIAEGIDWLARTCMARGAAIAAWGLTAIIVLCWTPLVHAQFLAKEQWPYARVAKFLHTQMQKNDVIVAGWTHWVHTLAILRTTLKIALCCQTNTLAKSLNELDAPLKGRVFYVTGPGILNGRTASVRQFGQVRSYQSIEAIPRGRC